ncbi:uncharacterized protein JCM10292_001588 [Rhodotorula paludigena]|uniref:uncharacterized protein n=1 Tax=Rhodotorula paludigena TaxID=86838 RepID=UPI00317A5F31
MRPVRQSSTNSLTSYASSTTSRASTASSLEMEKVTADLSLLVASFRSPTPTSTLDVRSLSPTSTVLELGADEVEEDEERERAERERLLRRVKSTIEIQARKMSRASSSTGSVSVVSEGGSTMTRGGYRAYKLARRSSFLHSPEQHRRRRTSSTSSRLSTGSSDDSSEAEELFDLSFDTPSTSPALERDGFAWSSSQSRYGRRKSSATTVDEPVSPTGASTVAMGRSQSDMGPSAGSMLRKYGAREGGQGSLALPTVMRRAESSDGVVRARPPALALPQIPDYSAHSSPAPQPPSSAAQPLTALAPSLRRRTSVAGSLSIPTTSTILTRNRSHGSIAGGSSPTRLATVQEPETEAEQSPFAAVRGLKPLALDVSGAPGSLRSSTQHGPQSKSSAVTPPKHRPLLTSASATALSTAYHAAAPSALPRATSRSPLAPRSTSPFFGARTIPSSRKSSLPLPASFAAATVRKRSLSTPTSHLPLSPNPPPHLPHGTKEVHKRKSSIATLPYLSSDTDDGSAECASIDGQQGSLRAVSAESGARGRAGVRMPCR